MMCHALSLCLILALALVAPGVQGDTNQPAYVSQEIVWVTPGPAQVDAVVPTALSNRVYLTIVLLTGGPRATIRFGTSVNNGELVGVGSSFPFGLNTLHYRVDIPDAEGQSFREEWTINGQRRPEIDRSGVIPVGSKALTSAIALSTSNPLPRGSYQLRFVVSGRTAGESQVLIQ